jgi:hypothetical protein
MHYNTVLYARLLPQLFLDTRDWNPTFLLNWGKKILPLIEKKLRSQMLFVYGIQGRRLGCARRSSRKISSWWLQDKVSLKNLIVQWSTCYIIIHFRMAGHGFSSYGSYWMLINHIHCAPLLHKLQVQRIILQCRQCNIYILYHLQQFKINIDGFNCTHICMICD